MKPTTNAVPASAALLKLGQLLQQDGAQPQIVSALELSNIKETSTGATVDTDNINFEKNKLKALRTGLGLSDKNNSSDSVKPALK